MKLLQQVNAGIAEQQRGFVSVQDFLVNGGEGVGVGSKKLDQCTDDDSNDHYGDKYLDEGESVRAFRHEPNRYVSLRPVRSLL